MSMVADEERVFKIGTLGWTADDLDDPKFERLWEQGRYEIIEGVLTEMPPAQFDSSASFVRLITRLQQHVDENNLGGSLAVETDIIVDLRKVAVADGVYLTAEKLDQQAALYAKKPNRKAGVRFGRLLVPPTLVIESVSLGHETHDRETKFKWYADMGVSHYWLFYGHRRLLECYALDKGNFRLEVAGQGNQQISPSVFAGLKIDLGRLW